MESILRAIETDIKNKNWYGALVLSLVVPDICGKLENPTLGSKERYIVWFNKYLTNKYGTHLLADDCYALRCSYIHEGTNVVEHQSARKVLDKFVFLSQGTAHCCHIQNIDFGGTSDDLKNILQLSVETFCNDMIESARKWLSDIQSINAIRERIAGMLKIEDKLTVGNGTIRFE